MALGHRLSKSIRGRDAMTDPDEQGQGMADPAVSHDPAGDGADCRCPGQSIDLPRRTYRREIEPQQKLRFRGSASRHHERGIEL